MTAAHLTIDLDAIVDNWSALASRSSGETAAVVKADGYGLDSGRVAAALRRAGARQFFVAVAEEAIKLRSAIGPEPQINVFSGHMAGDAALIQRLNLVPMLNSREQVERHLQALPDHPFGVQLDSGMNRLGMEPAEWHALAPDILARKPTLVMSHLACADEPDHPMNGQQLQAFRKMVDGIDAPRSLAATGGILLGHDYHFELTRPGIGLYGGFPFTEATPVVCLDIPVIQTRIVEAGETVGYGNSWTATAPTRIATIAAGYADGILRALSSKVTLWHNGTPCPLRGRVSMDLLTVEVPLDGPAPEHLTLLGPDQGVDVLADLADTIGYEILTSLGHRYARTYIGG